ncbi:MAG: AAA family ATPase [Thermoleophilia bacterium]|nr:AAA family ATPase [Thermoleophilia bacterium]
MFRAAGLAYKVKKPLVLPFLDYGTLQRRREMCVEEVRLNRRLAPGIYLGIVAIVPRGDGYSLAPADDRRAIEYAVEMRAVEEDRSVAALALTGEIDGRQIGAVATRIAHFHAAASVVPPERRSVTRLAAPLLDNLTTLKEAGGRILEQDRLRAAEDFTSAFLINEQALLVARAGEGRIREGHGDLRAEHVILPEQAPLYIYDCVEFERGLREIDVAADLAFLVMDLARLGREDLMSKLIDAYRLAGGDPGDDRLLFFFAAYRAWVRAVVACERVLELDIGDRGCAEKEAEARDLVELGHRFAWHARGPMLLLICGVSATGKTTLAERLAEASGWPHVSSDRIRKQIAGIGPEERGEESIYADELSARTYREMGHAAREALGNGSGVIVDATFNRRADCESFEEGLGEERHPSLVVECTCSRRTLLRRAREREEDPARVSDAGVEIVERQLAERDPLNHLVGVLPTRLGVEVEPARLVAEVEGLIDFPR